MKRWLCVPVLGLVVAGSGYGRQGQGGCGTYRDRVQDEILIHQRAVRLRRELAAHGRGIRVSGSAGTVRADAGDIAIIEDSGGVVARRDGFDLDQQTLTFTPSNAQATRYKVSVGSASYDTAAATSGARLDGLGDDDTRQIGVPFTFPFFGGTYQNIFVNSDGNLTFVASDTWSIERSVGRLTAGPPRIAPLFEDLDPSASATGVHVLAEVGRLVVTWVAVPEFAPFGFGTAMNFQVRLYPDGRIQYAYSGVPTSGAVVGIAPGGMQDGATLVSFLDPATANQEFSSTVAERFGQTVEMDFLSAAQQFYAGHDDSYDYLVIFNTLGIPDGPGSIASERNVRTHWTGNGDTPVDVGAWFGSASRLMGVINMGPLSQYPSDLNAFLPQRSTDTSISVLAHEAGHLFLAYASIPNPVSPNDPPMLGGQNAHWSFNFNSDASLVEGNRIQDNGAGASPRFRTTGAEQHYSPLDQYLMGFRAPDDVTPFHPMFFVPDSPYARTTLPRTGITFDGTRRDVALDELIAAVGRRTPDFTISQRRFRFGFMVVVAQGSQLSDADLAKLNSFRTLFEAYYQRAAECDGCSFVTAPPSADTTLRRALRLSIYPSAGVLVNSSAVVTVSVRTAPASDLSIALSTRSGLVAVPATVVIPDGATSATFTLTGLRPGVDDVQATPSDAGYETVFSRVHVVAAATTLRLVLVSGGNQAASPGVPLAAPVVIRVTDINDTSYQGVLVRATVTDGGTVTPTEALTDAGGSARFQWTPGAGPTHHLTATFAGGATLDVAALSAPAISAGGVVNGASFTHDIGAGSVVAIFGANLWNGEDGNTQGPPWPLTLSGVRVLFNGQAVPVQAVRETQVNAVLPSNLAAGTATLVISNQVGNSSVVQVPVTAVAPAIFMNAANDGAVQVAWSGQWTNVNPAEPGDYVEIYCTGLGAVHAVPGGLQVTDQPVRVFLNGLEVAQVTYNGLIPGYVGVYQINARIPEGTPNGVLPLAIEIAGTRSNTVNIRVQAE